MTTFFFLCLFEPFPHIIYTVPTICARRPAVAVTCLRLGQKKCPTASQRQGIRNEKNSYSYPE